MSDTDATHPLSIQTVQLSKGDLAAASELIGLAERGLIEQPTTIDRARPDGGPLGRLLITCYPATGAVLISAVSDTDDADGG